VQFNLIASFINEILFAFILLLFRNALPATEPTNSLLF